MDKLVKELKGLLQAYAQEQNAAWRLEYNEDMGTLTAELSGWKQRAKFKTVSVEYGPEDFANDDPTAADIFEFLKNTWEEEEDEQ